MATDLGMNFAPSLGIEVTPSADEPAHMGGVATTRGNAKSGYSLWVYDGTAWAMSKDRSAEGYAVAPAPTVPGRFAGQIRAILSTPIA